MARPNDINPESGPYSEAPFTDEAPTTVGPTSGGAARPVPPAKKSNLVLFVVLALIVLGVAGFGYVAYKRSHLARPVPVAVVPVNPPIVTSPKASADESALMGAPAKAATSASPLSALPSAASTAALPGSLPANPLNAPAPASTAALALNPAVSGSVAQPVAAASVLAPSAAPIGPASAAPVTVAPVVPGPASAGPINTSSPSTPPPAATGVNASPSDTSVGLAPRVDAVEQRLGAVESRLVAVEQGHAAKSAATVKPAASRPASPAKVASERAPVRHAARPHNHVELIQDKPVAKVSTLASKPVVSCKLASIVSNRAWVKQADGSFVTYGVGDEAPNGSTIKSIDPDAGIITERGKLTCSQGE